MESKHTPGPWRASRHCSSIYADLPNHDEPIAEIVGSNEANAHLIAAAPELLAALQELRNGGWLNFIFDKVAEETRGGPLTKADAVVSKARAAIAKAEGGAR
jgi:hypothetical protein